MSLRLFPISGLCSGLGVVAVTAWAFYSMEVQLSPISIAKLGYFWVLCWASTRGQDGATWKTQLGIPVVAVVAGVVLLFPISGWWILLQLWCALVLSFLVVATKRY